MLYKVSAGYSGSPFPVTELPWVLNHIQIPGTPSQTRTGISTLRGWPPDRLVR